jgi:uncharacterized protein (TIGR01244 family)
MIMLRFGVSVGLVVALIGTAQSSTADRCRAERDAVVLLHGLGRTPRSMAKLERALANDGYEVFNTRYPSKKESIEQLALGLDAALEDCCRGRDRYTHFVTHSMGGILLRYYLKSWPLDNVGRVVMLSPPNAGSELVDLLRQTPFLKDHIGPSREQLGTGPDDLPRALGGVDFELGVIAGDSGVAPPLSWIIPEEDDGIVAVERTHVEGMSDFIALPHAHSFIMRSDDVIGQTRAFLATGRFEPTDVMNFAHVDDDLFRGAQPGDEGVGELAAFGIRTIVNLRTDAEAVAAERIMAEAAGLRFIHIPLASRGRPDDATVERILQHLTDPANHPLFVHCRRGADRTGTIIACYRIARHGWPAEWARDEASGHGLGWWQYGMKGYIEDGCGEALKNIPSAGNAAQRPAAAPSR